MPSWTGSSTPTDYGTQKLVAKRTPKPFEATWALLPCEAKTFWWKNLDVSAPMLPPRFSHASRTLPARFPHASRTLPARVPHASPTRPPRVPNASQTPSRPNFPRGLDARCDFQKFKVPLSHSLKQRQPTLQLAVWKKKHPGHGMMTSYPAH